MSRPQHYFIHRVDKPGSETLRLQTRPAHLEYADTLGATLVFAGPTYTDDGKTMIGSVWVISASSIEDAKAITEADPYEQVNLFQSKLVQPLLKVVPADVPSS